MITETSNKLCGIVSGAFILHVFTDAKDKKFTSNFLLLFLKDHNERQNLHLF